MRKLISKLAAKYSRLTSCYEAGPTEYGFYRLIKSVGHECIVAAPSLIPKRPGERVKTNRRDAVNLTKLLRAGELTAVWVPDERHEGHARPLAPGSGPGKRVTGAGAHTASRKAKEGGTVHLAPHPYQR
jgi:transposase